MKLKKFICLFLLLAVAAGSFPFTASAKPLRDNEKTTQMYSPVLHLSPADYKNQETELSEKTDIEALRAHLHKYIMKAQSEIDISSFALPEGLAESVSDLIWYGMPEAFNAGAVGFKSLNRILVSVIIEYRPFADTAEEYKRCCERMEAAADRLLTGIEYNIKLADEYKALLLHDRLCLHTEYPYGTITEVEHTAYGALVNGSAVCQGYTMAYMYLLERVGIDSYYCSSEGLNHAWNIVYINGKAYHADVTWDDISWRVDKRGVPGTLNHDYFLCSTKVIDDSSHSANDYDKSPQDTKFDNAFWRDSETAIQLVGGKLYYINNKTGKLICHTDKKELADLSAKWPAGEYSWWSGNFARLSSAGGELLYSLPDGVYKYTVKSSETEKIYSPALETGFSVFGFTYKDGYLICDINTDPPYGNIRHLYQKRVKYDIASHIMCGIEVDSSEFNSCYRGDSLNTKKIQVFAVFSDGTTEPLSEGVEFTGFSSANAGTKTVTAHYKSFAAQFSVKVKAPVIAFGENKITLKENETVTSSVQTEPSGQTVVWKSSSDNVSVKNGKITAKKRGTAEITAEFTYNGRVYRDKLSVTVICAHRDVSEHPGIPPTAESTGYTKGIFCNSCKEYISGHEEIQLLVFGDGTRAKAHGKIIKTVPGISASELLSLSAAGSHIVTADGKPFKGDFLGTGSVLVLPDNSEYVLAVLGDCDGDANLSASDARLALRASVGLESYKEGSSYYAAANPEASDGISASDARIILRASVGLENPENWKL